MEQPGLLGRHRDKDGEISHKHGNTLVSTLRAIYRPGFAAGFDPHTKLSEVLAATGSLSLSALHRQQLHQDHDTGDLAKKLANPRVGNGSITFFGAVSIPMFYFREGDLSEVNSPR